MKIRFSLFVGLLLVASIYGQESSSTDASTVTSPATSPGTDATSAGTPATDASSPTASGSSASPVSAGSSESPGTGTTPSPASTASPASGATDGPTSAPVTVGGSTVSSGPTTSAPLPNVTFSLVQFGAPVCVDKTCTYEIDAPNNNQAVLATDQSQVAAERTVFGTYQVEADAKDAQVKAANKDALNKIKSLQATLDQIQQKMNDIQSNIAKIQNQQNSASNTLGYVEQYINSLTGAQSSCLYQKCLKPTTPAPPTTTPTPAPTTPPSPCLNFTCPGDVTGETYCNVSSTTNKPYCTNCQGNYDGYNHCDTIACSASGTPVVLDSSKNATWYSAGYINASVAVVPANSNCMYPLPGKYAVGTTGPELKLACLTSGNVKISFTSSDGSFSQSIASGTSPRALNNLLGKIPSGFMTLTSTLADTSYCVIPLNQIEQPSALFVEEEVPEKKNGFFSWLMGN